MHKRNDNIRIRHSSLSNKHRTLQHVHYLKDKTNSGQSQKQVHNGAACKRKLISRFHSQQ